MSVMPIHVARVGIGTTLVAMCFVAVSAQRLRTHRYRARSRRPEDDFVVRHTRMTLTGFGRFELAYFRHTGKWFTVFRGLTAAECFKEIEENEVFWPTT
jgi:hypothetical protein